MGMIYSPRGNSVLPNGTLINEVCHIYQSTTPTTRPDSSALVVGDKWYSPSTGVEGFWNGTYWLHTTLEKSGLVTYYNEGAGTKSSFFNYGKTSQILIDNIYFRVGKLTNAAWNASNFYTFQLYLGYQVGAGSELIHTQILLSEETGLTVPVNVLATPYSRNWSYSQLQSVASSTGTPGSIYGSINFSYREVL